MFLLRFCSSIFLSIPILISVFTYKTAFNSNLSTEPISLLLAGSAFVIIGIELFISKLRQQTYHLKPIPREIKHFWENPGLVILILTVFIASLVDLYTHGIVLFGERWRYSVFTEFEARIRHISLLIWTFAPLSVYFRFPLVMRGILFGWSLAFPILVLDRNRLLAALFSALIAWLILEWKNLSPKKKYSLFSIGIFSCLIVFTGIGSLRSGNSAIKSVYEDSRTQQLKVMGIPQPEFTCAIPEHLPIKDSIKELRPALQWAILYISSPIYNLEIQHYCRIRDSSRLKAQIIPFWKRFNKMGEPLLVSPRMNVGTETLPFYLALGIPGIILCVALAFGILKGAAAYHIKNPNPFSLLIFLRFAYCAVFFCFAPQMLLWTSFGFVILIIILKLCSPAFSLLFKRFIHKI